MQYLFLSTCVTFVVTAYVIARRDSARGLSFRSTDPGLNVVGLVTSNITAGTGFVYLLLNGAKNGLLACLLPLALLAGYRALVALLRDIPKRFFQPNFLQGTADEVTRATGTKSNLPAVLIFPLLITFVLLLGFEMFATSQLLGALVLDDGSLFDQGLIALALFVTTVAVVLWGGETTYRTDRIQAVLIVLCVLALATLVAAGWWQRPERHTGAFAIRAEPTVLASLLFASIAAFNTQLYSILNWNAVANAAPDKRDWVLLTSGNWLGLFVLAILFIGASMPDVWSSGFRNGVSGLMSDVPPAFAMLLSAVLVTGTTAIVLTTTQGITLAIGAFVTELLGGTADVAGGGQRPGSRLLYAGILAAVMGVLGAMFFLRPDLFFFLLAIVSGAETMVPLIILLMVLARSGQSLRVLSNRNLRPYSAFFVAAVVGNLVLTAHSPTFVPYASLILVFLSALHSVRLYRQAFIGAAPVRDAA